MRILVTAAAVLALATSAIAAPNVTNATQKGSLLIWPDIRVDNFWNTIVRIQNDGSVDVDVICYWMDGNKNKVDFLFTITKNQAIWFEAKTGTGTFNVNRFPVSVSNGFDNPDLISPGFSTEAADVNRPYFRGLLACWAVDGGAQTQIKWNHLSGTATVFNTAFDDILNAPGAYEYTAYAFFVPSGLDLAPVGAAGALQLNSVAYDACPLYQIGQFAPPVGRLSRGILVVDIGAGTGGLGALFWVDAATGARTLLSDFGAGANPGVNPSGVAKEASGAILIVDPTAGTASRGALFRVDAATGARTLLSDFGAGANQGAEPLGVAVEASGAILIVDPAAGTGGMGALFRVDAATGARTLLSDFGAGANPGVDPFGVAVEASGAILIVDPNAGTASRGALFRVDAATGARTLLSDFGAGANPGVDPIGVAVEASGAILVVDPGAGTLGRGALFRVDAATGSRTLLSDFGVGANPGFDPRGVAVEASGAILVADPNAGTGFQGALFRVDAATGGRTLLSDFGAGANPGVDPVGVAVISGAATLDVTATRLAIAGCSLNLAQDFVPVRTKLQFDVWNSDEVKFTGAFECADSWHETVFADPRAFAPEAAGLDALTLQQQTYARAGGPIDAAAANFSPATLGTDAARYRVQGVKSTQCPGSVAVGVLGVQSGDLQYPTGWIGTTLAGAGKFSGQIVWDPEGVVPEGGIR